MIWQQTLELLLQRIHSPLEREGLRWAVIGSAASALQGCRCSPHDIDLLAQEPECVDRIAQLLSEFAPVRSPVAPEEEDWISSHELPVRAGPDPYGQPWHFGRWWIGNFKVEAAHIQAPAGAPTSQDGVGIREAGAEIWPYLRIVMVAGYSVSVVPLEIQLQTNLARGLEDRQQDIVALLQKNGCDRLLLRKSLARNYHEQFKDLLREN